MLHKTFPARVKVLDGAADTGAAETGEFEALASTYDLDSVGDRVQPGAFGKSLAEWGQSGDPIPVVWSHLHEDPFAHIGEVTEASERDGEGLWVKGKLDITDNPTAAQVHRLMKTGRIRNLSFAYQVRDSAPASDGSTELRDLKLYEVGPCLIGANEHTRVLAVKRSRTGAKTAVPPHETETSDEEWDDEGNALALPEDAGAEVYAQAYAWADESADPAVKASWRYLHHFVDEQGTPGPASTQACAEGIDELNDDDLGGLNPEDRQGVWEHLAAHLADAGYDPPPLAEPEGAPQPDRPDDPDVPDPSQASVPAAKAGRVLSAKNESDLRAAADLISAVLAQLGTNTDDTSEDTGKSHKAHGEDETLPGKSNARTDDDLALQLELLKRRTTAS